MGKKDRNKIEYADSRQSKKSSEGKKKISGVVFIIGFLLFFVLSLLSWIYKIFFDTHLLGCVYKYWYPSALQAKGANEVVKTIGLCSLLMPWIYKKWDDLSFGLPYKNYIGNNFRGYTLMSVAQILITILCLAASGDGVRECAWLSLSAVIFGLAYQWFVFSELILRDELRIRLAPELWKKELCRESDSKKWDILIYLAALYSSSKGQDKQVYGHCLGSCLVEFLSNKLLGCTSETDLHRLSKIWSQILNETCYKEESKEAYLYRISEARFDRASELLNQIFKDPNVNKDNRSGIVLQLSAAYTVSLLIQNDLLSDIKDIEPLLGIFNSQSDSDNKLFFGEVHRTFVETCWTLFLMGQTNLQYVHVSIPLDTPKNTDATITETVLRLICRCYSIPLQDDFKKKLEIAISLTDRSRQESSGKTSKNSTSTPGGSNQIEKLSNDDDDDDSIEQQTCSRLEEPITV